MKFVRGALAVAVGYFVKGLIPGMAKEPDLVPLSCGAGVVEAVGDGVTRVKPGDRVTPIFALGWIDGQQAQADMLGGPVDGVAQQYRVFPADSLTLTPDELGDAWKDAKVHLPLVVHLNDRLFGRPNAGVDMTFDYGQLIAHVAKTRELEAGSIIGSGTVSNADRSCGSACIAERRMLETIEQGKPETPFLKFGDRVRIDMKLPDGASIFGAIDQQVKRYEGPK